MEVNCTRIAAVVISLATVLRLCSSEVPREENHQADGHCDSTLGTCTVQDGALLTVQCGPRQDLVSYRYQLTNGTVLENDTTQFLSFHASRETHNNLFICCRTNDSQYSMCYRINVTYAPITVSASSVGLPVYGDQFSLLCPLEANPVATYRWQRYSIDLTENLGMPHDVVFTLNGQKLNFDSIKDGHNGQYVCYASNSLGTAKYGEGRSEFFMEVSACDYVGSIEPELVRIEITSVLSNSTTFQYSEGSSSQIACVMPHVAYNIPPYWYRSVDCSATGDMVSLDHDPRYTVERSYDWHRCAWISVLNISNFSEDVTGEYHCGSCAYNFDHQTLLLEDEESLMSGIIRQMSSTQLTVLITGICTVIPILLIYVGVILSRPFMSVSYTATEEPPAQGFVYDVFISAHEETRVTVQERILHSLENECAPSYKVCWHHRDFVAGVPITEQIAEAVQTSRKVVLVLSEHFSESKFCCQELEQTLHRLMMTRTRCLIPLVLCEGAVPRQLSRRITYWPVVNAQEENFVHKLTNLIGKPIP